MAKGFKFMYEGFKRMDRQFQKVDKRLDGVEQRFKKVDQQFDKVDSRFEKIALITSDSFTQVHADIATLQVDLEYKIDGLRGDMAATRAELKGDIAKIDQRLSKIETNIILQDTV